jgi:hypothetical protein
MMMNFFEKRNFMKPMNGKAQECNSRCLNSFPFMFGRGMDGERIFFFSFFPCSQCVPLMFP